jgi:hypothetical protein
MTAHLLIAAYALAGEAPGAQMRPPARRYRRVSSPGKGDDTRQCLENDRNSRAEPQKALLESAETVRGCRRNEMIAVTLGTAGLALQISPAGRYLILER